MSKKEIPTELKERLEEFHVEVPDISMRKSRSERVANWIYAPAKTPLEVLGVKGDSIRKLVFYPFAIIFLLFFLPVILI